MANNKITLTIAVDDKGSLKIVAKDAKTTAKAMDQVAASTDRVASSTQRANTKRNLYNKQEKGVGQLTNNSTKAFAKQAQTVGGVLVPAYATLAANIFAITAAFGALQRAAAAEQLKQGLVEVGSAAGQNLPFVAAKLREITGAAVSTRAAMSGIALGFSAGFSTTQLEDLTRVAKGASLALGRDMEDALTRLVKGAAKLEPEILDELGIMVRLDTAASNYAVTLNKTAGQLTQFERRQAFLNEIITQGTDKFGQIAEVIAANPYDQLAASFSDLTTSGFKLLNTVVTPLIKFLSQSQFALTGALVLFGATIISKIVPALSLMAEGQQKVALSSAAAAKSLGAKSQGKFTRTVQSVSGFDIAPKNVKVLEEAYRKGIVTVEQLRSSVISLGNAEKSRAAFLRKWTLQIKNLEEVNKTANAKEITANNIAIEKLKEKIALKTQELALVRTSITQNQAAIDLSGLAGKAGAAELSALSRNRMARRQGAAFLALEGATVKQTFAIVGKTIKNHIGEVSKASGAWATFTKVLGVTAKSATLVGRAFLNLIPIIGQVLFFAALLTPLYQKFFGDTEAEKESKKVIKSFESIIGISSRLQKALSSTNIISERYHLNLRVEIGLLDQLVAGIKSVQKARQEEANSEANDLAVKISKDRAELARLEAGGAARAPRNFGGRGFEEEESAKLREMSALRISLLEKEGTLREQLNKANTLSIKETLELMNAFLVLTEMQGVEAPIALKDASAIVDKLKKDLKDGVFAGAGGDVKFFSAFEKATNPLKSANTAIIGAADAISQYEKEVVKLGNKQITPFDDLISNFDSLVALMADAKIESEQGLNELLRKNEKFAEDLFNAYIQLNPAKTIADALKVLIAYDPQTAAIQISEELNISRVLIAEMNGEVKLLEAQLNSIKGISADNSDVLTKVLGLEQEVLGTKIRAKEEELKLKTLVGASRENVEAEKIALEEALRIKEATVGIELQIARARDDAKVLANRVKFQAAEEAILKARREISALDLKGRSSLANQDVSAVDSQKLFKEELQARLVNESKAYALRAESINSEYELLKLQTLLEERKAETLGIQSDSYTTLLEGIEASRQRAQDANTAGFGATVANIGGEGVELDRAVLQERIAQANERSALAVERYEIAGNAVAAAEEKLRQATSERLRMQMEVLTADPSLDTSAKELEVQKQITAELQAQIALLQAKAAVGARLGGEQFGEALGISASLAASEATFAGEDTAAKIAAMSAALSPMIEQLKSISPEGEAMSAAISGAFAMSEAFTVAFGDIAGGSLTMATGLQAAASVVNSLAQVQAAQSKAAIAGMDRQIEAEKKRDGKSAQSLAKIAALEKKQEAMKRKAFEQNKKMQMAQTVISTITAAMGAYASLSSIPIVGPALGAAAAAAIAAIGAAQLSAIASTSFDGGGSVSSSGGPSAVSVGERSNVIDLAKSRSPSGELGYVRGEAGAGTGATNFTPGGFAGTRHRAAGGNTGFMVGEQGPELFVPNTPGRVIPADDVGATGAPMYINFKIDAVDATGVEDLLLRNRGNIIGMIREAANANGEFFLETVSTHQQQARNKVA